MPWWLWSLLAALALYVLLLAVLVLAGRREHAEAVARLVPDCVVLAQRLARDPRVPRARKATLLVLAAYLAMPLDIVPDFLPVVGALDDAIIVVLVLRGVVRAAGPELLEEHWPGPPLGLDGLRRALRV